MMKENVSDAQDSGRKTIYLEQEMRKWRHTRKVKDEREEAVILLQNEVVFFFAWEAMSICGELLVLTGQVLKASKASANHLPQVTSTTFCLNNGRQQQSGRQRKEIEECVVAAAKTNPNTFFKYFNSK
ncbi:hypothetical protein XELAEV_18040825mg [Xenopus laevis]|uniref:Uncharacterized protein n=1 Tax=Xenopus laevis TaxID=8355 RepID=A0A974H996_XENLA|nr:hypothetical protein XELAEV_18040825mg [Xenopus laevis]